MTDQKSLKKIILLDNNQDLSKRLIKFLGKKGFNTDHYRNGKKIIQKAKDLTNEVLICNYKMRDMDGIQFLSYFRSANQHTPVIFISQYDDVKFVVKCMRKGAFDYVTQPIQPEEILETVTRAFDKLNEKDKNPKHKETLKPQKKQNQTHYIKGKSDHALQIQKNIELVAPTNFSVIIQGETGTGKEFAANRIHQQSERVHGPFIALDCGALPKELAGSELFGHKKGSFTGAIDNKVGCFEKAHNGTLFLDEIGNLSFDHQLKLLRVLQEKKIKPIGSNRAKAVNVRVLAATNEDLKQMVNEGAFREDLYYRLNEFKIELESLRNRKADLFLFASYFLKNTNEALHKDVTGFSKNAEELMNQHNWPGNLRELKNAIKRATLLCKGKKIKAEHLPIDLASTEKASKQEVLSLKTLIEQTERKAIKRALELTRFNKTKTAEILEIDRKTLYHKIDQYNL